VAKAPREQVFAALYQLLLTGDYPFEIVNEGQGRLMRQWDQFPSANQPALYLQEGPQKAEQNTPGGALGLNRWLYTAKAWFLFRRDAAVLPATVYNQILDAVDAVIVPPAFPGQKQTLAAQNGGKPLVTNVRLTEAMWDEGTLDPVVGQVIVMVGFEILTSN
jgi:hypothetical protein